METTVDQTASTLDAAVAGDTLRCAYQPIVDLRRGEVLGFEALARWRDPALHPGMVFAHANELGRVAELDWACRRAAICGALDAGLGPDLALFVNVEPSTLAAPPPSWVPSLLERVEGRLRPVIELTERSLLERPREVLRLVGSARERGWGIALDDVAAHPESLTMLPFVEPDVIKLDLHLVQRRPGLEQGRVMAAVLAHAEATGATVLAEGIETHAHVEQATAFGAELGQGWYFGRPGDLVDVAPPSSPMRLAAARTNVPPTPFALVAGMPRLAVGRRDVLLAISNHLESLGLGHDDLVLLGCFQTAARFTPSTRRRYEVLARHCALVGAFGVAMPEVPALGVRGASLAAGDDLADEWSVIVVGSHYAGALIARDLGDTGPEDARRFEFVVTHDRPLVLDAARSLMARLEASS